MAPYPSLDGFINIGGEGGWAPQVREETFLHQEILDPSPLSHKR